MINVTFINILDPIMNQTTEHAIIEYADGSFTSMLKSTYDEKLALENAPEL